MIKRTVTILLPKALNRLATVKVCGQVQQALLPPCCNESQLLGAIATQHESNDSVKGKLRAKMIISAIPIGGTSKPAKSNQKSVTKFFILKARPWFLVRHQGKVNNVRPDSRPSSLAVVNRKQIKYRRPEVPSILCNVPIDSFPLFKCSKKLVGRVAVTKGVLEFKFWCSN